MHFEGKLKLKSHNSSYWLIEVVTKGDLNAFLLKKTITKTSFCSHCAISSIFIICFACLYIVLMCSCYWSRKWGKWLRTKNYWFSCPRIRLEMEVLRFRSWIKCCEQITLFRTTAYFAFVCPFVLFLLAIVLSDLFRFTDSDYPSGIFKLFLQTFPQLDIRVRVIVFNTTSNKISVISWRSVLLVEETEVPEENQRPFASHCQTLSHNVISSTPRHERDSNSQR
jgi:hypothetical protein